MGLLQLLHELQQAGVWRQHADVGGFRRTANPAFSGAVLYRHQFPVHHSPGLKHRFLYRVADSGPNLRGNHLSFRYFRRGLEYLNRYSQPEKEKISRSYQWHWYPGLVLPGRLIGLVEGPPSSLQTVSNTRGLSYKTRKLRWENMEQPGL